MLSQNIDSSSPAVSRTPLSTAVSATRLPGAPAAPSAPAAPARRDAPAAPAPLEGARALDLTALAIRTSLDRLAGTLARVAAGFVAARAWREFGHARVDDHARERFGRSGRWLRDLAALGSALAVSQALADALTGSDGARPIGRVATLLIARAVPPGPIDEWITLARRVSVRELRAALRRARDPAGDAEVTVESDLGPENEPVLVRLPVPQAVHAAFDETRDLHRSIEGRESSIVGFVEALVAEAHSGRPVDAAGSISAVVHGIRDATIESALRRSTSAWAALPEPHGSPGGHGPLRGAEGDASLEAAVVAAVTPAVGSVIEFDAIDTGGAGVDARALDGHMRALVRLEDELESRLGDVLAAMSDTGAWSRLRFASVGHYAEERLGLSRSRAGERARLARVLRAHPRLAAACATGRISMEAAAIIHRAIGDSPVSGDSPRASSPETRAPGKNSGKASSPGGNVPGPGAFDGWAALDLETAWIDHASAATIKRMRDELRAIGRYRVRWSRLPAAAAFPLDDERWHASLHRRPGTARRRVFEFGLRAAGVDAACNDAAAGDDGAVDGRLSSGDDSGRASSEPDVFQVTPREPDVFLRLRLPAALAMDLLAAMETARAALEQRAATTAWDEPWPASNADEPGETPTPAAWIARTEFVRGRRLPLWVGLLALLEEFVLTWDHDAAAPERRDDRVFARDGWRCAAPGCTSRRNLEDHHVLYRSRGGGDGPGNRVTLCRFHHQQGEHGGLMTVCGEAPLGLTWRLGRAGLAVTYRNERCFTGD